MGFFTGLKKKEDLSKASSGIDLPPPPPLPGMQRGMPAENPPVPLPPTPMPGLAVPQAPNAIANPKQATMQPLFPTPLPVPSTKTGQQLLANPPLPAPPLQSSAPWPLPPAGMANSIPPPVLRFPSQNPPAMPQMPASPLPNQPGPAIPTFKELNKPLGQDMMSSESVAFPLPGAGMTQKSPAPQPKTTIRPLELDLPPLELHKTRRVPESLPTLPTLTFSIPELKKNFRDYDTPDEGYGLPALVTSNMEIPSFEISEELPVLPALEVTEIMPEEYIQTNFRHSEQKAPLFIRTDHYSNVIATVDHIKNYVNESTEVISMLENLKKNAEMEHRNYRGILEDIQRKLIYVDKMLFERDGNAQG